MTERLSDAPDPMADPEGYALWCEMIVCTHCDGVGEDWIEDEYDHYFGECGFPMSVIRQCAADADWPRIIEWWFSAGRKSAALVFTAGPDRQIAYSFESLGAREFAWNRAPGDVGELVEKLRDWLQGSLSPQLRHEISRAADALCAQAAEIERLKQALVETSGKAMDEIRGAVSARVVELDAGAKRLLDAKEQPHA